MVFRRGFGYFIENANRNFFETEFMGLLVGEKSIRSVIRVVQQIGILLEKLVGKFLIKGHAWLEDFDKRKTLVIVGFNDCFCKFWNIASICAGDKSCTGGDGKS